MYETVVVQEVRVICSGASKASLTPVLITGGDFQIHTELIWCVLYK